MNLILMQYAIFARSTMTDSYQKIIDDIKTVRHQITGDTGAEKTVLILNEILNRMEALKESPYRWMDKDGDQHVSGDLKDIGYTIPLIRGD